MTTRLLRISLMAIGSLALAGGVAMAQGDPCDMPPADGGGYGDPCAGGGEAAPPPGEAGADAAGPAPGSIRAGAVIMIPKGIDDQGDISLGGWVEVTPWVMYQVNEKIAAGVEMPLMLVKPDFGDVFEVDTLQAIMINGEYAVNPNLTGKGMVGLGVAGRLGINPFGSGQGVPGGGGDTEVGFGAGAGYVHSMDKIKLAVDAMLIVQMDSASDDMGELKPLIVLHVPVGAYYQVDEFFNDTATTEIYTADELSFDADEGFTMPFVLGGKYAVNPNLGVGGFLGLGSLVTHDGLDVGDTLTLGFFVVWSK